MGRLEPGVLVTWITLAVTLILGGLAIAATSAHRWLAVAGWLLILISSAIGIWLIATQAHRWKKALFIGIAGVPLVTLALAIWTSIGGVEVEVDQLVSITTQGAGVVAETPPSGVYIFFPNVRITNKGTEPVALLAKLTIDWQKGGRSEHDPWLDHIPIAQWTFSILHPPLQERPPLIFPINLAPKTSLQGSIAFLVPDSQLNSLGEWTNEEHFVLKMEDALTGDVTVAYEG